MPKDINDLRRDRKQAADQMQEAADKIAALESQDIDQESEDMINAVKAFNDAESEFNALNTSVNRAETVEAAQASAAQGGDDVNTISDKNTVAAAPVSEQDKGVAAGLIFQALAANKGDMDKAVEFLNVGGHSSISAALSGATQSAGGVTIPRPQATELIELLRPRVAVRASGARTIDIPAGEIRYARQNAPATATYEAENSPIPVSEPTFDSVEFNFKKLTALVPVGNSLLRHSSASLARLVRDDLLKVMALREDLAFIRGDGSGNSPKGLKKWMLAKNWKSGVAKDPLVVDAALRGCVSMVEDADVGMVSCGWIMRAATKNFLASLRDPKGGNYLFPSITQSGSLLGYQIKTTSQIPSNLGTNTNETEVYFADFDEVYIGDSMDLSFATSTEAGYVDKSNKFHSVFQEDKTLFRTISEHDLAPAHDPALAGLSGVGWTL